MGYTHYWKNLKQNDVNIANNIVNDILKNIYTKNSKPLYNLDIEKDKDYDEYIHEINFDNKGNIAIFTIEDFDFCKTARKKYDIAVWLGLRYLLMNADLHNASVTSDGSMNYDTAIEYIQNELDIAMYTQEELQYIDFIFNKYDL